MEAFSLTARQHQQLEMVLHETCDSRVYRRVLGILEVSQGASVEEVAQTLGVTRQSVYNWLSRFDSKECWGSLIDRPRSGRPRLLREHRQAWLKDMMRQRPEARGYFANEWTVPLLQEELFHCTGQNVSAGTIRRSLVQLGYVWKRARYVLSPDPEAGKKRRVFRQMRHLPERSVLLAEDETDLLLFPPLRSCWRIRGQPACVTLSGRNARRVIFGALNLRTGHRLLLPCEQKRAVDFQAFLSFVHEHYRGWHVVWLLDSDSSHTAAGSQRLGKKFNMEFLWLPKRSPELNPLDHLWGHGKDEICGNRQYETIDGQVKKFITYLTSLSPQEVLRKAGVLSDDSWLAEVL